jgi:endonuclease III
VLKSGWYVYTGSALGGLRGRLTRHLRTTERRHWHVDALLAAGSVADIQLLATDRKSDECGIAALVSHWRGASPVPGFGAGDCRCSSHLCYFEQRPGGSIHARQMLPALPRWFAEMRRCYRNYTAEERDPFRQLVSCILSLRTQDPVTDAAAERLFEHMQTPQDFAQADAHQIAGIIYPVGMYNQKAKTLVEIGRQILSRFDGRTPADLDDLLSLPGVGRKTANLVRSFAFNLPSICVDTHVHRISNRWGLVRTASPDDTEKELRDILPDQYWLELNPYLVQHGQRVCTPRKPHCESCVMVAECQFPQLVTENAIRAKIPDAPPHPSL